jgi:ABC-type antimicrobial peptide transport system permease subunit
VAQITVASFGLNAAVLVFVSSISFVALQVFAAQSRSAEFGVLRAMGLSTQQLLGILALEGFIMLGLGLVVGTGIGYGLAYIMRPFLSLSLASSLGGKAIDRVLINWNVLGPIYAVLVSVYLLSIAFLLVALLRSKIHRVMRIGEE